MAQEQFDTNSLLLAIGAKDKDLIAKHREKNIPITAAHISRAIKTIGAENSVADTTKAILNMVFRYAYSFNVLTEAALKILVIESLNSRNKTAIDLILQIDEFNKALKIDDEIIICAIKNILEKPTASLDPLFDLLDFAVKKGHPLTSKILDELLNAGKINQRQYPLFIQEICERLVKIKDFKFNSDQILNAVKLKPADASTWQLVDAAIKTNSPLSEDVFVQYLENGANNYQGFNLERVYVKNSSSLESDIADIRFKQKPNYPLLVEIEDSLSSKIQYRLYEKNQKNQITVVDLPSDSVEQYPTSKRNSSIIKTQHINFSETTFLFKTLKKQSDLVQDTANQLLNVIAKNNGVTEKSLSFAVGKKDEYWIKTIYKSIASQTPETQFRENKILGDAFLAVSDVGKAALIDTAAEKRPNDLAVFLDYAVYHKLEKIVVDTIIPKLAITSIQIKPQLVINTINFLGPKLTAENLLILWNKLDKNNINANLLNAILKYYSLSDQAYRNIAVEVFDALTARSILVDVNFDEYTKKHDPKAKEDQKSVSPEPPSSSQQPGSPQPGTQQPRPAPAAVDYNAIKSNLAKHWNKVIDKFKESDYDYIEQRTTRFTAFNAIDTLLKNDPLTKQQVIDVYENINHVLNTKTAKFYLKPAIYESLLNFQHQVEFDCAYICDKNKDAGKNLLVQIHREVNQFLANRKLKNPERPEERHDGLVDVGKINQTKLDGYGEVKNAAFFYLVKQIAHQRLNDKFNFLNKITRNKDVAEFYKLFDETSLFTVSGSPKEIEYNTSSLVHLRDKLQQFNQKLQSEITQNKTPGLNGN